MVGVVQSARMPPDIEYFLDAALEHNEIDAACHYALRLYAPRDAVVATIDTTKWKLGHSELRPRLAICESLTGIADDVIATLDHDRRAAVALVGVRHLKMAAQESARWMAWSAIEDMLVGGCMEPYIRPITKWGNNYALSPKMRRRLYGPRWIRRYVKLNIDQWDCTLARGRRITRRIDGLDLSNAADLTLLIEAELAAQRQAHRRAESLAVHRFVASEPKHEEKAKRRARRKVIRRAADCATTVVGAAAVSDFARGVPVRLIGETIAFEVHRAGSSAAMGHSGLHVVALDPKSMAPLADLCVYHDKTPALDQLTALALAVNAGEESDIINTANLSNITEAGLRNDMVATRGGRAAQIREWTPRDRRQEVNEAYWNDTKPIWMEAVGVHALGRYWGKV